jgi:hypothetical protein
MYGELEEELFEGKGKKIFEKYKPVMEKILDKRVFYIRKQQEKFYLNEGCDDYFTIELTPEICDDLSLFFKDLSDYMANE